MHTIRTLLALLSFAAQSAAIDIRDITSKPTANHPRFSDKAVWPALEGDRCLSQDPGELIRVYRGRVKRGQWEDRLKPEEKYTIISVKSETGTVEAHNRETGERVDVPENVAAALRENARAQSKGLKGATTEVHRAYVYADSNGYFDDVKLSDDNRIVAVDVTFRNFTPGFDLDDVDLIDADSGENFGSDPHLEGMVADGVLADIDDPDVWAVSNTVRVLLVYAPPKSTIRIKLGYWGEVLTPKPIKLLPDGPHIAKSSVGSVTCWHAGPADTRHDRYLAVLAVRNWYRNRSPKYARLKCSANINADVDRFIELEDDGKPVTSKLAERPHLLAARRFLLEFWVPKGHTPKGFHEWGEVHPVLLRKTTIPDATMAALHEAPVNKNARHRLDEALRRIKAKAGDP